MSAKCMGNGKPQGGRVVPKWMWAAGWGPQRPVHLYLHACVYSYLSPFAFTGDDISGYIKGLNILIKPPTRSSGLISKINQHAEVRFTLPARSRARSERVACAHRSSTSQGQCDSEQRRAPRRQGRGLRPVQIEVEMTLGLSRLWQYWGQPKTVAPLDPVCVVHGSAQTLNPQSLYTPYVPT